MSPFKDYDLKYKAEKISGISGYICITNKSGRLQKSPEKIDNNDNGVTNTMTNSQPIMC